MKRDFRALLTGSAAVTAYAPPLRIEWGTRTQGNPLPGVVLNLIGNADGLSMDGPDGWFEGRVQVDCYALDYDDADALAEAIREILHGYSGGDFQLIRHDRTQEEFEGGAADRPFRISQDFQTIWSES